MNETSKNTIINKSIKLLLLVLLLFLILGVTKYIGINSLLIKIFRAFIPVFIAIITSFIVEPVIGLFERKNIKRRYAVILSYCLLLIILVLIVVFTIPQFAKQLKVFISSIPALLDTLDVFFEKIGLGQAKEQISSMLNNFFITISNTMLKKLSSSISIILNLFLGISGGVFLSFDYLKFKEAVKQKIPNRIKKPVVFYFRNFQPFVHKYVLGMLIDSLLIFIISVIGFSIIGIDYTLVIALFIAVTNLIPIIGNYIGGIPAALIGFSISPNLGLSAIIVVFIVQIIESNFLQPLILKNVIKLHPLEGILGLSLFGALFGLIGMIISPILIVAIKLMFLPYNTQIEETIE